MRASGPPVLFPALEREVSDPEPLQIKEIVQSKAEVYLNLFHTAAPVSRLRIPETLMKLNHLQEPLFLWNRRTGEIEGTDSKAIDAFFRATSTVQMMDTFSNPSPLQLPKYVVQVPSEVFFSADQSEVLRRIQSLDHYLVQRFIPSQHQHASKYRIKWIQGHPPAVTLLTRKTQIPFNSPAIKEKTSHSRPLLRPRKHCSVSSIHKLSKSVYHRSFSELALSVNVGSSPYTAAFSIVDECLVTEVHRQDVYDAVEQVISFLKLKVNHEGNLLHAAEFDLLQDLAHFYFLNLKSHSIVAKDAVFPLTLKNMNLRKKTHRRIRSNADKSLLDMRHFVERPLQEFITHTKYIDLSDVQDKNIKLYQRIKDTFSVF